MSKWIFDLADPNTSSLWKTWILNSKCHREGIWTVAAKQTDSKWWKDLLQLRDEIKQKIGLNQIQETSTTLSRNELGNWIYRNLSQQFNEVSWWKMIWHRYNIPKCSFLAWIAYHGRTMTRERLSRFKRMQDTRRVLCRDADESDTHLFFHCTFSHQVLQIVMSRLELNIGRLCLQDWISLFLNARTVNDFYKMRSAALNACIYIIWWARNQQIFEGLSIEPDKCAARVITMLKWLSLIHI